MLRMLYDGPVALLGCEGVLPDRIESVQTADEVRREGIGSFDMSWQTNIAPTRLGHLFFIYSLELF